MASGALAPWLPGVLIEELTGTSGRPVERLYWDGGITSNSSFKHIMQHLPVSDSEFKGKQVLIFVIDLWGAFDREPKTFDEVCWRIKQTQFSSRIEQDIKYAREFISNERLKRLKDSSERLKEKRQQVPSKGAPAEWPLSRIDIIRVSYLAHPNEIPSGDALFSRTEIERRISDGYAAMSHRLEMDPPLWKADLKNLSADNKEYSGAEVAIHLF
jgi:hypothetical protein